MARIAIIVNGGQVQRVLTDDPDNVEIEVLDTDHPSFETAEEEAEITEIVDRANEVVADPTMKGVY